MSTGKNHYLVTGVAGFIGSQVALDLIQSGHAVTGIDNLNDYYDVRIKSHRLSWFERLSPDQFRFVEGDIEDRPLVESLFRENSFAAVLNLAARAGVRYSVENPIVYCTTNTLATLHLLEAMRHHQVPKMVLASTSSLYAGQPLPFTEDMPVNQPISPYAASKKAAEMHAYSHHHLFGLDISVVRYFTVYGPAGRPDMSIFRFIKWIDEGKPIEIYGDGHQSRDFTYVTDISAGTIAALQPVGYQVFNIGGGKDPVSLLQVIAELEKNLGKKARLDYYPPAAADMTETRADVSKVRKVLGWEPLVSLTVGLLKSCDWYRANQAWVKDIVV